MKANGIPAEIGFRIKRPYSVYQKMKTQRIEFGQVYDFLALRIITDTVKNCYAALGIIHQNWTPMTQRFRDFIAMPKPNLYQALHTTILTPDKRSYEIQIRTREMHALAENGIAAHWKYKDEDAQSLIREDRRLQWLREMVELFRDQKNPREFLKNLKINLIPEEVYVFTPKGRVVSLPSGRVGPRFRLPHPLRDRPPRRPGPDQRRSSPRSRPLLRTGDIVEIITDARRAPSRSALADGLHVGRPPSAQALAQPPGEGEERRRRPEALGEGAPRLSACRRIPEADRPGRAGRGRLGPARGDGGRRVRPGRAGQDHLQPAVPGQGLPRASPARSKARDAGGGEAALPLKEGGETARPPGQVLPADPGRADRRLHHGGQGHHGPRPALLARRPGGPRPRAHGRRLLGRDRPGHASGPGSLIRASADSPASSPR